MRTDIFYFSGTGNSLQVARDLAGELTDTALVSIPRAMEGGCSSEASRVGIVFPVYMWGLPLMVAAFARRLSVLPGTTVFAVATCGGSAGATLRQLARILADNGIALAHGAVIKMPGNYTPLYGAISADAQQKLFSAAAIRIKAIATQLREGERGRIDAGWFPFNALLSGIVYALGSRQIPRADRKFRVLDSCTRCGLCARLCPAKDIVLVDGKPTWQGRCEQCLACLQWCPVEAIQSGTSTVGKKRYHHPSVRPEDLAR